MAHAPGPALEGSSPHPVADFLDLINPASWFRTHKSSSAAAPAAASQDFLEVLNPLTWFKSADASASGHSAPHITQNPTPADDAAAAEALGFPPGFLSPEGSGMPEEHSVAASERSSGSSSSSSGSSHTSDFSDGTYASSSDSGSGSSAPAEESDSQNVYEWRQKFKEQLSDSSDVVDMNDGSEDDDW